MKNWYQRAFSRLPKGKRLPMFSIFGCLILGILALVLMAAAFPGMQHASGLQQLQATGGLPQGYAAINSGNITLCDTFGCQTTVVSTKAVVPGFYIVTGSVEIDVALTDTPRCWIGSTNGFSGSMTGYSGPFSTDHVATTIAVTESLHVTATDHIEILCAASTNRSQAHVASVTAIQLNAIG